MKRTLLLSILGAAITLAHDRPSEARAGKMEHVLPPSAGAPVQTEARPEQPGTQSAATPAGSRRSARQRRNTRVRQDQIPRTPTRTGPDPETVFAALKLFRVNQRAMVVCDRIAIRRGVEPPRRLGFLLRVNGAGNARVQVVAPKPIRPGIARCYRAIAASWSFPTTGVPYTLVLSRIAPRRGTLDR